MAKNKKISGKKAALIVLNVVLSLVFSVLLLFTVYVEWVLGRFYHDPSQDETLSSAQLDQPGLGQPRQATLAP